MSDDKHEGLPAREKMHAALVLLGRAGVDWGPQMHSANAKVKQAATDFCDVYFAPAGVACPRCGKPVVAVDGLQRRACQYCGWRSPLEDK